MKKKRIRYNKLKKNRYSRVQEKRIVARKSISSSTDFLYNDLIVIDK